MAASDVTYPVHKPEYGLPIINEKDVITVSQRLKDDVFKSDLVKLHFCMSVVYLEIR